MLWAHPRRAVAFYDTLIELSNGKAVGSDGVITKFFTVF